MNPILYILFFIGIFFTGDELILILSYFSAHGYWSIIPIFFIIILANLSADICWFLFGNKILNLFKWKRLKKYKQKTKLLLRKSKRPEILLFMSKFIYGTRVLTIVTFGVNSTLSLTRFIIIDCLALIPITIILLSLGWFAGKGVYLINIYKNIQLSIFILVIFLIFIYIVRKWINGRYVRSSQHITKKKE